MSRKAAALGVDMVIATTDLAGAIIDTDGTDDEKTLLALMGRGRDNDDETNQIRASAAFVMWPEKAVLTIKLLAALLIRSGHADMLRREFSEDAQYGVEFGSSESF